MSAETRRTLEAGAILPCVLADVDVHTPVLLAFSGGMDSSVLLHWLLSVEAGDRFPLTLCHLDHGIRGAEAERDRLFCEEIAARYALPIAVGYADVPARVARTGESLEEAAREERYAFFARVMRERGIPLLVTAHHATDQLETVLFRLSRGTSLHGLSGMSPARPFGEGMLVRPFLSVTREEIAEYCEKHDVPFVEDSTNADPCVARNRLRQEVLPVLESLFPDVAARTAGLCARLREDEEYLDTLAGELLLSHASENEISLDALSYAPMPVRRRALRRWVTERCGRCLSVHEETLLRFLSDAPPAMEVALHAECICVREGAVLRIYSRGGVGTLSPTPLSLGTQVLLGEWIAETVTTAQESIKVHNSSTSPYIILKKDFDIIKSGLFWRSRRDGDVLLLHGMHKRLRRLQAEAGVPVHLRPSLPLLCDGEGILWAPGIGVRDGAAAMREEDGGLLIRLTRR